MREVGHTLKQVRQLASAQGWRELVYQPNIGMISFVRGAGEDAVRMNIYLTKMTIATAMKHPKKGRTQLYRKYQNMKSLKRLLINPRQHTGEGYYTKG